MLTHDELLKKLKGHLLEDGYDIDYKYKGENTIRIKEFGLYFDISQSDNGQYQVISRYDTEEVIVTVTGKELDLCLDAAEAADPRPTPPPLRSEPVFNPFHSLDRG